MLYYNSRARRPGSGGPAAAAAAAAAGGLAGAASEEARTADGRATPPEEPFVMLTDNVSNEYDPHPLQHLTKRIIECTIKMYDLSGKHIC